MAKVDAYDSMTSERPYRKALPPENAIAELYQCSGTQFDPALADKFVEIMLK
jgi:HD-GYP domain-containing protein (c-di-GMP phosphodiesterase class II)